MTGELMVLVRIALYMLAARLGTLGLPPELVTLITNDPGLAELLAQGAAVLLAGLVYAWSRIAKRLGWAT